MAFWKTIAPKTLDLPEICLGKFFVVAPIEHAADELILEDANAAGLLERRHGAPQPVGVARREAGRNDGDFHRLFLKKRNSIGLLQHMLELGRRVAPKVRSPDLRASNAVSPFFIRAAPAVMR